MAVYLVTGKLGSGKSLATVGRIRDYLNQGRMVATNLDLKLEKLVNPWAKNTRVMRLPDKPTLEDLENLPSPYEGEYDETKTGAIVLDECGTWFNTREYRDKSRQPLINKLLHIRKAGWDVFFIIQHIEMIDKQVREGLGEHVVYCQRADRLGIPFFTMFSKLFGLNLRPPKVHLAIVKYGTSTLAPVVDRWVYQGKDLYSAYDTRQVFGANDAQLHSMLPPYTVFGRYYSHKQVAKEKTKNVINRIKNYAKTAKRSFFLIGLTIGSCISFFNGSEPKMVQAKESVVTQEDSKPQPEDEEVNVLDYVRIYAFIRKNDGFEYYFKNTQTDEYYYPNSDGYHVRIVNDCTAKLTKDNYSYLVRCKAKKPAGGRT